MRPGETDDDKKAQYFTIYDSDGLLASGNVGEGIVCAPAGAELQWKRKIATAYANSAGVFAHVGGGLYRYIPSNAEVQASDGESTAMLKIEKAGFRTQFIPFPILGGDIQRILGLLHQNALLDGGAGVTTGPTYSTDGVLLSGRLRVFADAAALAAATAGAANNADGEIYRYVITGEDTGAGLVKSFRISKAL